MASSVVVRGYVRDTLQDGWYAVTQVRYEVYDSYQHSRYPTRSVHARACVGYSDGRVSACSGWV